MRDDEAVTRFFAGDERGRELFDVVSAAIAELGESEMRIGRSQIAFRRRRGFAYVRRPDRYLSTTVPAVLSIALRDRVDSDRFTEIVHPSPSVWMHHLELRDPEQVDGEARGWLAAAYAEAE